MTTSTWTIETVLEDYISERKLSRRKLAFLEQFHKHQLHGAVHDMIGFLPKAPAHICEALDLQSGCTWAGVVAELLDFIHSEKNGHKVTLHTWQLANSTTEEPPEILPKEKIINERNILCSFISNKALTAVRKLFLMNKHNDRLRQMEYSMVHGNKWEGELCPDFIIKGLNDLAKEKEFPKHLDDLTPYYDLAVAFALDLIHWMDNLEVFEDDLDKNLGDIYQCMNYFDNAFEGVFTNETT